MKDKFITVDGTKTCYWEGPFDPFDQDSGSPRAGPRGDELRAREKRETILFLHGWGGPWSRRDKTLPLLEKDFHVITVDFPGYGRSEPLDNVHNTLDAYADFTLKFIKKMRLSPLHLIGHSMGSVVAVRCALKRPKLFKKLILVGFSTNYHDDLPPKGKALAGPLLKLTKAKVGRRALSKLGEVGFGQQLLAFGVTLACALPHTKLTKIRSQARRRRVSYKNTSGRTLVENMVDILNCTYGDELKSLRPPVLLIYGKNERIVSQERRNSLVERYPKFRKIEIPGAGHVIMDDKPEELARAIRTFLEN